MQSAPRGSCVLSCRENERIPSDTEARRGEFVFSSSQEQYFRALPMFIPTIVALTVERGLQYQTFPVTYARHGCGVRKCKVGTALLKRCQHGHTRAVRVWPHTFSVSTASLCWHSFTRAVSAHPSVLYRHGHTHAVSARPRSCTGGTATLMQCQPGHTHGMSA